MKKNILITGASGGLGKALAQEYLNQGHCVIGCGRSQYINIESLHYASVDLTDYVQLSAWLAKVISKNDHIDLCVNCAGTLTSGRMIWEYSADETTSMIDINVIGLINLMRSVIPQMKQQGYGRFVTMASNPAGYPLEGLSLYAICKTAVEKVISLIGKELPADVIAVALYPGLINTPMLSKSIGVDAAAAYQVPDDWARQAGDAILNLRQKYQGRHISLEELLK